MTCQLILCCVQAHAALWFPFGMKSWGFAPSSAAVAPRGANCSQCSLCLLYELLTPELLAVLPCHKGDPGVSVERPGHGKVE